MNDSKIFVPLVPSLLHLAEVKEAIKLYNDFHIETLEEANRRIQVGISMTSGDSKNYPGCNSAQKRLLFIPPYSRKRVLEAIHGLKCQVNLWKEEHSYIRGLDDEEFIFYWRCNGTMDSVKTAQQVVLNSNIDMIKRFYLACMYCLEETIQTLWAEMEANGTTENLDTDYYLVVRFWVRWLRHGSRDPWKKTTRGYLAISYPGIRFNSFFPALSPDEREMFLYTLNLATYDDLRFCLYEITKEEEEKFLRWCPFKVLLSYLHWPMRSLFIETAGKIWQYIDEITYRNILDHLLSSKINREVFDFYDFFECFWKCSPSHLKEKVKKLPHLREKIESCLNIVRRKRKAHFDELINSNDKKVVGI